MLPKNRKSTHPGEILKEEFLTPLGIKLTALARTVGVTHTVISEIVHGKRNLSPRICVLLARALGTTPEFWGELQADYDISLYLQSPEGKVEMKKIKPLVAVARAVKFPAKERR